MVVGSLELHLRMDGCRTLKEKRRVLRPLIERLRRDLRASVAEVGDNDLWNVATIGLACVGPSRIAVESVLDSAEQIANEYGEIRVEGILREVY